jgi:hypothetical protein
MDMKKLGSLIVLFVLLFGFGCGDDDDDGSAGSGASADSGTAGNGGMDAGSSGTGGAAGEGGTGGTEPMDASLDGGAPAPTLADLQGTWVGPCYETQDGDNQRAVLTFDGDKAVMQLELYGQNNPTCQDVLLSIDMEMTASVGGPALLQAGAYRLDVEITKVEATMHSAEAVDYANSQGLFGYTDWVLDVPKDVAGKEFAPSDVDAGTGGEAAPAVGTTTFLNFALNDAKDRLRMSDMGSRGQLSTDEYVKQ